MEREFRTIIRSKHFNRLTYSKDLRELEMNKRLRPLTYCQFKLQSIDLLVSEVLIPVSRSKLIRLSPKRDVGDKVLKHIQSPF